MENNWKGDTSARIGRAVQAARKGRYTALELSARCAELGHPIHRTTITKIEKGRGSFEIADLLILAAALGVPPIMLIYPDMPDGPVEVLPNRTEPTYRAIDWFDGDATLGGEVTDYAARELFDAFKLRAHLSQSRLKLLTFSGPSKPVWREGNEKIAEDLARREAQMTARIRDLGGVLGEASHGDD